MTALSQSYTTVKTAALRFHREPAGVTEEAVMDGESSFWLETFFGPEMKQKADCLTDLEYRKVITSTFN